MVGGEIESELFRYDAHCDPRRSGQPPCTRSQLYLYSMDGAPVALVHQYTRPDGTLGGSGMPDPKVLVLADGVTTLRAQASGP